MTITFLQVEQAVKHWGSFIKAHERLLVILLSAALLFHFGEKGLTAWDNHNAREANIAQQKVNVDIETTKKQDAVVANLQAQLTQVTITANAAMAAAHAKAEAQRKVDATLPLPKLADRWSTLINSKPNGVVATMDIPSGTDISNTITVSSDAAHQTVDQLEVAADNAVALDSTRKQLGACANVTAAQATDLTYWKNQYTDEHNARLDDAKKAKTAQTKAYLKGLKHGIIIGVAGTVIATVAILH